MSKNRKITVVILTLGIIISAFFLSSGCFKKDIVNLNSQGRNVICFGDSISFGYGVNPGEDYPANLSKLLGFTAINSGIDGDTSADGLKRLESDVLSKDPLLVIVEFGGNDFLKKVSREDTLNNISQMVDRIQEKGAMVAIADISAGMFFRDYRIMLRRLARQKGSIFVPSLLKGIITTPQLKSDFLHPNAQGYAIVAGRVHRVIEPYLKINSLFRKGSS